MDTVALIVIVAVIVVSENLLSGIVVIPLLGILDVLVDIQVSLGEGDAASDSA